MTYPERFQNLPPYAFPRLRALLDSHTPGGEPVAMTIGEPKHPFPDWLGEEVARNVADFGRYPPVDGAPEVLEALAGWLERRFGVTLDPARLSVTNGSREGIYAAGIALCPERKRGERPYVLMPNPFYQVYAASALAAQARPLYLPADAATGFLPDFDAVPPEVLDRTALVYICSPANPQGAVADGAYLARLLALAERHDFIVMADECYSEIWRDSPPPGLLEVAARTGADPERVVVFNSLSKRSNVPGLRVGMIAAGPQTMARIRRLRSYSGAQVPLPLQRVAARLWADEEHVAASRRLYGEKFALVERIFAGHAGVHPPQGGFFLWLPVPAAIGDGEAAALRAWVETGVRVLPGGYLGRETALPWGAPGPNPGAGYLRVALVAPVDEVARGLTRLRDCLLRDSLT